jgi:selenophosphate synthetase-related protein
MSEGLLSEVIAAVRSHRGLRAKAAISVVADVFGGGDWWEGPGDDGAVVPLGDADHLVVGGEAMWPPFVAADPFGAGIAAVLANVNDLAAMGAEPLALVDTVVAPEDVARRALEGMRYASQLYGVPVVGGHLTIADGPPAVSAFGLGRAGKEVLSARRAQPGQALVLAACTEGTMRADFPFFSSFEARGDRLAGDVRLLARLAADGVAVAAKDVSMAGLLGSLAMLLECNGLGVTVDLQALPRPPAVSLPQWAVSFPCFAFLLCISPGREDECLEAFRTRGLAAAVAGTLDGSGLLRARLDGEPTTVVDVASEPVTGLRRQQVGRITPEGRGGSS